jgi:hypothetical protein
MDTTIDDIAVHDRTVTKPQRLVDRDAAPVDPPSRASKRTGAAVFAAVALATIVGIIVSAVSNSGNRDPFEIAQTELAEALPKLAFATHLPETLPEGTRLLRTYLKEPDVDEGTVYQLTTWYTTSRPGDRATQVWQTNEAYLKRRALDPSEQPGREVVVSEESWWRLDGSNEQRIAGVSYSRKFDDGVTVVVSGMSDATVTDMIGRLNRVNRATPKPSN